MLIDTLRQDLRDAYRALRRMPGFTVASVLTLALGLGASVAVFTVVDAIYFSTLPYLDPSRLVMIQTSRAGDGCEPVCGAMIAPRELREWPSLLPGVVGLAAVSAWGGVASLPAGPESREWAVVSSNFFSLIGQRPMLGRALVAADDEPGVEGVVVLSHEFWQAEFGGDTTVIGRSLPLNGVPHRIVGIMPASAAVGRPLYNANGLTASFFVPVGPTRTQFLTSAAVIARLAPNASMDLLRARLSVLVANTEHEPGAARPADKTGRKWTATITSLREVHAKSYSASYPLFLGTVLMVLLITCVNLAGLFLARLSARRREIAVRAALGAGRARLVRQFLTEGMVITGLAGVLGVLVAAWGIQLSRLLPPGAIPYWTHVSIHGRVVAFALALAVVCGALFGLGPSLLLSRTDANLSLRDVSGALVGGRAVTTTRRLLVGAEIACTLVLVTGAGLVAKTFIGAATRDFGFARHDAVQGLLSKVPGSVPWTGPQETNLFRRLLDRLQHLPGVDAAALSAESREGRAPGMTREGDHEMIPNGVAPSRPNHVITPDYFSAWGARIADGRAFTAQDNESSLPVAIISDSTAKRLFPNGHAVGKRIKFGPPSSDAPWLTIVGVAAGPGCLAIRQIDCGYLPELYRPLAQDFATEKNVPKLFLRLHGNGDGEAFKPIVRAAIREIDPTISAYLYTVEWRIEMDLAPIRVNAVILGAFAIFALALASLGLYAVVAELVTQRTPEIGIRMALGANAVDIRRLILRSVAAMAVAGIGSGAVIAFALTRLMRSILFTTSPTDPRVFIIAGVVLSGVVFAAAYVPARRATRIDPVRALRAE